MPNPRSGWLQKDSKGRLWACVKYADPSTIDPKTGNAKIRQLRRRIPTNSRIEGRDKLRQLLAELERSGGTPPRQRGTTFAELARFYVEHYAREAEYDGDTKIRGLRSRRTVIWIVEGILMPRLGRMQLKQITYGTLSRLKSDFIAEIEPILVNGEPRKEKRFSIASCNRFLAILRRMLRVAVWERLIDQSPFEHGPSLISARSERKRDRILADAEEQPLLASCETEHTRDAIVILLDTGMRFGELARLTWRDVDFAGSVIHVTKMNSKTQLAREIGITPRVRKILVDRQNGAAATARVLGVRSIKRSFATACRRAGITGLTIHGLRHTCGTRLARQGKTPGEIARILGHSQIETTFRYINTDRSDLTSAADELHAYVADRVMGREETSAGNEDVN